MNKKWKWNKFKHEKHTKMKKMKKWKKGVNGKKGKNKTYENEKDTIIKNKIKNKK